MDQRERCRSYRRHGQYGQGLHLPMEKHPLQAVCTIRPWNTVIRRWWRISSSCGAGVQRCPSAPLLLVLSAAIRILCVVIALACLHAKSAGKIALAASGRPLILSI